MAIWQACQAFEPDVCARDTQPDFLPAPPLPALAASLRVCRQALIWAGSGVTDHVNLHCDCTTLLHFIPDAPWLDSGCALVQNVSRTVGIVAQAVSFAIPTLAESLADAPEIPYQCQGQAAMPRKAGDTCYPLSECHGRVDVAVKDNASLCGELKRASADPALPVPGPCVSSSPAADDDQRF